MSRTFVVVGASTGLGRATARALARVDLRDLGDAARFARELAGRGPIHGLACNAGIQHIGAPAFTPDGFEETFAVSDATADPARGEAAVILQRG